MKKSILFVVVVSWLLTVCLSSCKTARTDLSAESRHLYNALQKLKDTAVIFGHQDDLAYGLGWQYEAGRSDVKAVTGSYPGVYGWDLGHIEHDSSRNLDSVPFHAMKAYIKEVYERGGINTLSWHLDNPVNGKTAWDNSTNTVKEIIPGGKSHEKFKIWLDKVAAFIGDLKGAHGESIPVLFRPYHEHTGNWFWWGESTCTPAEYKQLWQFTVNYLRKEKRLCQILFVYSSARFESIAHYEDRYPGDAYIDLVGFDTYCKPQEWDYVTTIDKQLQLLQQVAQKHRKIPALTETGYVTIPQKDWWTKTLLPLLAKYKLSYVLVWRNARPDHYYAPFPGQQSAADFKIFYESGRVLFQNRLTTYRIYQQ